MEVFLDSIHNRGLLLTDSKIRQYLLWKQSVPLLETQCTEMQAILDSAGRLSTMYDAVLVMKDRRIALLTEMNGELQNRGDLYKDLASASHESWLGSIWKTIAFPAGLAIGVVAGVLATR